MTGHSEIDPPRKDGQSQDCRQQVQNRPYTISWDMVITPSPKRRRLLAARMRRHPTLCRERPIRARCSMTCALTTLRGADNPHTGHSCQRSARVLGTAAPHTHVWLVPRGSTFTSSRPALAALYQSLAKKEFHPASWTEPANIPCESPLMLRSSTAINHSVPPASG